MITANSFNTALNWVEAGMKNGREFAPVDSDIAQIGRMRGKGIEAFLRRFDKWVQKPSRRTLEHFHVPKANGKVRDVFYIPVFDKVATLAILLTDFEAIERRLNPTQGTLDYCHPLPRTTGNVRWFTDYKKQIRDFRSRTAGLISSGHHMLLTDIANFSGSVDITKLKEAMIRAGVSHERAGKLYEILATWQQRDGLTGLPQDQVITALLNKIYMHSVDVKMTRFTAANPDVSYYRYSDDIRLAAKDAGTLRRAHDVLVSALDDLGLKLGPEKTDWHSPQAPVNSTLDTFSLAAYFEPCLRGERLKLGRHMPACVERMLASGDIPVNVLKSVYNTYIGPHKTCPQDTPPSLFNFTLYKMAFSQMAVPAGDLRYLLANNTDRFPTVLNHLRVLESRRVNISAHVLALEGMFSQPDNNLGGMPFCRFQFIRFLGSMKHLPACANALSRLSSSTSGQPAIVLRAVNDARFTPTAALPEPAPRRHYA